LGGTAAGHVNAYRWQSDEAFVDFDPSKGDDALEAVASQWHEAKFETVAYRGQAAHAYSPIGAKSKL